MNVYGAVRVDGFTQTSHGLSPAEYPSYISIRYKYKIDIYNRATFTIW